ncbi:hypothetical protein AVEN_77494-1 [Araneus ventricosus]|uniref:Tc1-like transposase DDE domain-containing protein n=1 Tax=Araneus ventricosus TaxID=182803 RepID=A0A4Y2P469_ARAVE|nr:hypothetical protein AVEN_77494-1 [Araneus ventricosus]
MAGRIDASGKCELHLFFAFCEAEGVFVENDQCGCFCQTLRRAIPTSGVILIHDNVHPHSAVVTQQLLEQFKWDVSDHPAYSPDFHLFHELKNWLGGQSVQKNKKVQSNVKAHLTSLAETLFEDGIRNLVHRLYKCLNLHGDYLEK